MKKVLNFVKKHWVVLALFIIITGAFFVRTYKFEQWLYFKMDQSRDSLLISNAIVNGPEYLPLLGARAGATTLQHGYLRLGPIFYYFQYISGKIFNSIEPPVFAYPDLFFSILAIPLLYLLLRIYFDKKNSLLITAMYSFSFLVIQYSRFSWNPNALQFFQLLAFYGLLKFFSEKRLTRKKWWIALWAIGITVGSQLHFFGFFSLLGISGILFAFNLGIWKKESWKNYLKKDNLKIFGKYVFVVAVIFGILYAPVILSEFKKGGQNTHNFFEALGSKPEKKPLVSKLIKDAKENARYYCLVTTSECYDSGLKKFALPIVFTAVIMFFGLLLAVRNILREKDLDRKNFLILIISWVTLFTILTIPVSYQLRPRFYIVVFAIPFIMLGFIFEYMEKRIGKKAIYISLALTLLVLGINVNGTLAWFDEQAKSQISDVPIQRSLILKAKDGVTLGQLQGVTDWMYARRRSGANLYYYIKPEHVRPLNFLLWEKRDPNLVYTTLKLNQDSNAQYFAITSAGEGTKPITDKYGDKFKVIANKQFGQITIYEIEFFDRITSQSFKFNKKNTKSDRIFWKDIFGIKNNPKNLIQIDSAE